MIDLICALVVEVLFKEIIWGGYFKVSCIGIMSNVMWFFYLAKKIHFFFWCGLIADSCCCCWLLGLVSVEVWVCCDMTLGDKMVKWRELYLRNFYFVYIIFIPTCYLFFSQLVRNVITHSPCVVCVWILWWSRTLCSWE